jgi:hypothetical protein
MDDISIGTAEGIVVEESLTSRTCSIGYARNNLDQRNGICGRSGMDV